MALTEAGSYESRSTASSQTRKSDESGFFWEQSDTNDDLDSGKDWKEAAARMNPIEEYSQSGTVSSDELIALSHELGLHPSPQHF